MKFFIIGDLERKFKDLEAKRSDDETKVKTSESKMLTQSTVINSSKSCSSMPQLFPRPIDINVSQTQDILAPSSTSESLLMPSFPSALYSSSIPLFGQRYFSALNHAAATASLGPHHSPLSPFLRTGMGNMAQLLANHSASSIFQTGTLEKTLAKDRGECSSITHPIHDFSSQVMLILLKTPLYLLF